MNNPPTIISTIEAVVRLADEGIPIYAISRALRLPADYVREYVQGALDSGVIVDHPRDDWSPGSLRATRSPDIEGFFGNDEGLYRACQKYYRTTRQQSIILGMLLRRSEVTKENLHQAIERDRPLGKEDTSQKLVDVLICILRRKLKPTAKEWYGDASHKIIHTMWGQGYLINAADRVRALAELHAFVTRTRDVGAAVEDRIECAA